MRAVFAMTVTAALLLAPPALAKAHKTKQAAPPVESLSRTGTGEGDYGLDETAVPLPEQPVVAMPPVPVADDGFSERNFTYVPPGASAPATPAPRMQTVEAEPLQAGQSFHGTDMAVPAAPFETGIALDQQGFEDLWQRIGQPAPAGRLAPGMGAVFASNGPQITSGHDVRLRTLNDDGDKGPLLVEVTFVQPSPRVAISRADTCPWRILIVPASNIKLLAHRSYAGVAAK